MKLEHEKKEVIRINPIFCLVKKSDNPSSFKITFNAEPNANSNGNALQMKGWGFLLSKCFTTSIIDNVKEDAAVYYDGLIEEKRTLESALFSSVLGLAVFLLGWRAKISVFGVFFLVLLVLLSLILLIRIIAIVNPRPADKPAKNDSIKL